MCVSWQENGFPLLYHIGFFSRKETEFSQSVLPLFSGSPPARLCFDYSLLDNLNLIFFFFIKKMIWINIHCFPKNLIFFFFSPFRSESSFLNALVEILPLSVLEYNYLNFRKMVMFHIPQVIYLAEHSPSLADSSHSNSPACFPGEWGRCIPGREVPFQPLILCWASISFMEV